MKQKCECDKKGILRTGYEIMYHPVKELPFVEHEPGKCACTNEIKPYVRNGKKVLLCSCCYLSSDIKVLK